MKNRQKGAIFMGGLGDGCATKLKDQLVEAYNNSSFSAHYIDLTEKVKNVLKARDRDAAYKYFALNFSKSLPPEYNLYNTFVHKQ